VAKDAGAKAVAVAKVASRTAANFMVLFCRCNVVSVDTWAGFKLDGESWNQLVESDVLLLSCYL
jgi:hypothetical protein